MAYDPQPFVATQSGSAEDAPSSAKPITLYGVEGGGATLPINASDIVVTSDEGTEVSFVDAWTGNINNLGQAIEALEGRIEALESAAE